MEAVQAMQIMNPFEIQQMQSIDTFEAFSKMYNLKFLQINAIFHYSQHLPNSLRFLDWMHYPSKSLPSTFQPDELVCLCLQYSKIEELWIGRKVILLLSILTTLHLNLNKSDTRKLINLTSFLTFFFFLLLTEF